MNKLKTNDKDRIECGYLSQVEKFEQDVEVHSKYRKGLITLSLASIIYNLAGITFKGSNLGLISGSITTPSIIIYAILASLIYHQILYVIFIISKYEKYKLSILVPKIKNEFYTYLTKHLITEKLTQHLQRSKELGVLKVEIFDDSFSYESQKFRVYTSASLLNSGGVNVGKKMLEQIKSLGFHAEHIILNRADLSQFNGGKLDFKWRYQASRDDQEFLARYFKNLRFDNIRIFFEYRVPLYLSLIALTTYCLQFENVMNILHKLNESIF